MGVKELWNPNRHVFVLNRVHTCIIGYVAVHRPGWAVGASKKSEKNWLGYPNNLSHIGRREPEPISTKLVISGRLTDFISFANFCVHRLKSSRLARVEWAFHTFNWYGLQSTLHCILLGYAVFVQQQWSHCSALALCIVCMDGESFKRERLLFRGKSDENSLTDQNQTWRKLNHIDAQRLTKVIVIAAEFRLLIIWGSCSFRLLFNFPNIGHSPNASANSDAWWLKQRGLTNENAFLGSRSRQLFLRVGIPEKHFCKTHPKMSHGSSEKSNPKLPSNGSDNETAVTKSMMRSRPSNFT